MAALSWNYPKNCLMSLITCRSIEQSQPERRKIAAGPGTTQPFCLRGDLRITCLLIESSNHTDSTVPYASSCAAKFLSCPRPSERPRLLGLFHGALRCRVVFQVRPPRDSFPTTGHHSRFPDKLGERCITLKWCKQRWLVRFAEHGRQRGERFGCAASCTLHHSVQPYGWFERKRMALRKCFFFFCVCRECLRQQSIFHRERLPTYLFVAPRATWGIY